MSHASSSRDLDGVCSGRGLDAPSYVDGEVTSMEVDEREEGEMEAIDNAVLERRGDIEVES